MAQRRGTTDRHTGRINVIFMASLEELYQQTIDNQRNYLLKLQEEFNKKCDELKKRAEEKMAICPEDDKEAKQTVLMEQKKGLEEALRWLKTEVNQSTRQTMKKLEEIQKQREQKVLEDLEKQIASL